MSVRGVVDWCRAFDADGETTTRNRQPGPARKNARPINLARLDGANGERNVVRRPQSRTVVVPAATPARKLAMARAVNTSIPASRSAR
jgi:hypothetical protein